MGNLEVEESRTANMKEVVVMRHDLKMRHGKQIAKGAGYTDVMGWAQAMLRPVQRVENVRT